MPGVRHDSPGFPLTSPALLPCWLSAFHAPAALAQIAIPVRTDEELAAIILKVSRTERANLSVLLQANQSLISPHLQDRLIEYAASSYYSGSPEQALALYEIALGLAQRLKDQKRIAATHYSIGRTYSGMGRIEAAIQSYLASQRVFESAGLHRDLIYILSDLSSLYFYKEDYQQARDYAEQSLALAHKLKTFPTPAGSWPDEYGVAGALSVLGELSQREGNYAQAFDYLQKSLTLYQKLDSGTLKFAFQIADVLTSLGRLDRVTGDNLQALLYLNQALTLAKKLPYPDRLGNILNSLGVLYLEQEDYAQAADCLRQSLKAYLASTNQAEAAMVLLNLGVTYQRQGRFDEALDYYNQSIRQASSATDRDTIIAAGEGIAVVQREKKNYTAALEALDRSLVLAKELNNQLRLAEIFWRRAEVYLAMGSLSEAAPAAEQAFQLAQKLQLPKLSYLTARRRWGRFTAGRIALNWRFSFWRRPSSRSRRCAIRWPGGNRNDSFSSRAKSVPIIR